MKTDSDGIKRITSGHLRLYVVPAALLGQNQSRTFTNLKDARRAIKVAPEVALQPVTGPRANRHLSRLMKYGTRPGNFS